MKLYKISFVLALLTLFVLCSANANEPTEGAPQRSVAIDATLNYVPLYQKIYEDTTYIEGKAAITTKRTELHLDGGEYFRHISTANLKKVERFLDEYNEHELRDMSGASTDWQGQLVEDMKNRGEYFAPYRDNREVFLRRADSTAVSFASWQDTYTGGAHGMYGIVGVNIDTADGKKLSLGDVVKISPALTEAIVESLRQEYPPQTFFDGFEQSIAKEINEQSINWTLEPRGITFYFNPYDIAPYASGLLTASIMFDERPGFFREKYLHAPAQYCEYLVNGVPLTVSLTDDLSGHHDKLRVDDYGDKIRIELNGVSYTDENPAKNMNAIFVHTEKGRNYLYVDCDDVTSGERGIRIYGLDGGQPVFVEQAANTFDCPLFENGNGYTSRFVMTNPEEFRVEEFAPEGRRTHTVNVGEYGGIVFG